MNATDKRAVRQLQKVIRLIESGRKAVYSVVVTHNVDGEVSVLAELVKPEDTKQ